MAKAVANRKEILATLKFKMDCHENPAACLAMTETGRHFCNSVESSDYCRIDSIDCHDLTALSLAMTR